MGRRAWLSAQIVWWTVATGTGQIFHSPDAGATWKTIATHLPPILSVSAAVV